MVAYVRVKGVKRTKKRLADGTVKEFHYHRATGTPLPGKPGSPEYLAALVKAEEKLKAAPAGTFMSIIAKYKASADYKTKGKKTKRDYERYIDAIEQTFGDLPLAALDDRRVRGEFREWRDAMAETPRKADYAWSVLGRILSWAKDGALINHNHAEKGGRLYDGGDRAEIIWHPADLDRLFASCSQEIMAAVVLALWTGQRQGDCLRLPWSAYDGAGLKIRQGKTDAYVYVPVGPSVRKLLDGLPRTSTTILTNSKGRAWTEDGFRTSFWKACDKAGTREELRFHDLRGTAITRLALAGCTVAEISSLTGHSLKTVEEVLQKHYLGGKAQLAAAAMSKMEAAYGVASTLLLGDGTKPL